MRKTVITKLVLLCIVSMLISSCAKVSQPLAIAQVFTDHMVLQANKPVSVWGKASPGKKVVISIRQQVKTVKADEKGNWLVELDPEAYGEVATLTIKSGKDQIEFDDILYGEVWICSGQSNMEMPMVSNWAHVNGVEEEVKNANFPEIRLFSIDKNTSFQPIDTIRTEGWQVCDTNTVKNFSATAYFFGRYLYQELKVPIGLVHTSWGGTVAEAWTSKSSLLQTSDFAKRAQQIADLNASRDSLQKKYDKDLRIMNHEILSADKGFSGTNAIYSNPELDDSEWTPIDLPKMWEETSLGNYDGSTWFRKFITLSNSDAQQTWTLQYGAPDDWDEAWINGVKVGENKEWNVLRKYEVPKEILKEGENIITLRVYDYVGGGGFMGEADQFKMISEKGKKISIAKDWVAKKGFDFKDINTIPVSLDDPNQPTVLFNAMISPLLNMTFQGAIWYQGESNAGRAYQYQSLFQTLIKDWRTNFNNGDFPFYFVQLANYLARNTVPVEDTWAELREAQTMALKLPNTGMAVTIDIGDALDIHPGNKQDVGKRLALNALAQTYGRPVEYSGPLYKSHKVVGGAIEIEFEFHTQLQSADKQELKGFAIAGADSVFVWAEASIANNKVTVWNKNIPEPIAVRYAWSANPACNLTNNTGLPASPFRTDKFKGITE